MELSRKLTKRDRDPPVMLTSYSIKKQDSLDAYLHEWQTIRRQSQVYEVHEAEDDKDEQSELASYAEDLLCGCIH